MPTYFCLPEPDEGSGGVAEVLRAHRRLLPKYGWHEVKRESDADLVVGHLGADTNRLDVFHLHGLYPTAEGGYGGPFWNMNAVVIENIRRARNVIAVSEWVANLLRRDMHLNPLVLGHGVDLEAWDAVETGKFSDQTFTLWNKTRRYGVCDPTPIIELANRLPLHKFVTTFLSEGHEATPNIRVTGLLPRPAAWEVVKDASIYLATTKETFGIGILEAMAAGAVVVGFDWGAVPTVLGDCGILVKPGDYDALAEAVREGLDRREELSIKARQRVAQHYTWEAVVEQLASRYDHILASLNTSGPKVSVIIPCYCYARFVTQSIRSVLAQTYTDYELIVVDDGSTDDSVAVIQDAIRDIPHARLIRQPNAGVAHARNRGIAEAKGEYICCLDADDALDTEYLATVVPALDTDHSLGIAYTGIQIMNEAGRLSGKVHPWPNPYEIERGLHGNQIPTCCLFRRSMWARLGGYRQRYAPHGAGQEDGDFWFRILANGGSAEMVSPSGLFHYRLHPSQTSNINAADFKQDICTPWYPFVKDGQHPLASQLDTPPQKSWPVRDYDKPEISVIIPVGPGHTACLIDALDSVEAQTFRNWELVVVNDSGELLDLTPWPFARLVETDGETGAGFARNRGTEVAISPLIVYLDADDFLQPDFLEATLGTWKIRGGWVYSDIFILHHDGRLEEYNVSDWNVQKLWRSGLAAVTCLYAKSDWQQVGGFDEESTREDWDFHLRLAHAGVCGTRIPKPLLTYRHATGKRRDTGSIRQEALKLRKLYDREELEMACRGCGKSKSVPPPMPNWETKEGAGWVLLEYIGKNRNDLTFRGATNRTYRFGNNDYNRIKRVHPDDAARLQMHKCFRVRGTIEAQDNVLRAAAQPAVLVPSVPVEDTVAVVPIAGIESEPVPEPKPIPVPDAPVFDPSTLSVAKIQTYDFTNHDLYAILKRERAGKDRKMVVRHLKKLIRRAERET